MSVRTLNLAQQRLSKDATAHPHQPGAHPDPQHPDPAHNRRHHPAKAKVKSPLRNRIFKKADLVGTGKTRILFPRSTRQLPSSCPARFAVTAMPILPSMTMPLALLLTLMIAPEFLFAFVGSVLGLFFFLFMFPLASYVEGTSLTTPHRYQDLRLIF